MLTVQNKSEYGLFKLNVNVGCWFFFRIVCSQVIVVSRCILRRTRKTRPQGRWSRMTWTPGRWSRTRKQVKTSGFMCSDFLIFFCWFVCLFAQLRRPRKQTKSFKNSFAIKHDASVVKRFFFPKATDRMISITAHTKCLNFLKSADFTDVLTGIHIMFLH